MCFPIVDSVTFSCNTQYMDQTAPAMPPPPPPPLQPTMQTKHNSTVGVMIIGTIVLSISCLIAGYFWGLADGKKSPVSTTTATQTMMKKDETVTNPTTVPVAGACKYYGGLSPNSYFPKYTVKARTRVGQVAEETLGTSTRSYEIVQLNKTLYPDLLDAESPVEPGSELVVLPKDLKRTSGSLEIFSGRINVTGERFGISFGESTSAGAIYIPQSQVANIPNLQQYTVGDCVVAISDRGVGEIIKIEKQ